MIAWARDRMGFSADPYIRQKHTHTHTRKFDDTRTEIKLIRKYFYKFFAFITKILHESLFGLQNISLDENMNSVWIAFLKKIRIMVLSVVRWKCYFSIYRACLQNVQSSDGQSNLNRIWNRVDQNATIVFHNVFQTKIYQWEFVRL